MRSRILSFDSTFGLSRQVARRVTLHNSTASRSTIPSQNAVPRFDDTRSYWSDSDRHASTGNHKGRYQPGWYSVDVPNTGTTMHGAQGARQRHHGHPRGPQAEPARELIPTDRADAVDGRPSAASAVLGASTVAR